MVHWDDYKQDRQHSVVGNLLVTRHIWSPQLDNHRDLLVWLPYTYDGTRRYPVLYMQDGNNLFDAYNSFAGEWGVDETMTSLAEQGIEAIIVGIPNNEQRMLEYSPYTDTRFHMPSARGEAYVRFIIETIKPIIDTDFCTQPEAWATGIAGSSMGGLISLHGFLKYPDVFGFAGVFSPSFWFGNGQLYETIDQTWGVNGRLYLDIGAKEGRSGNRYMQGVRRIADSMRYKGYYDSNFMYVEDRNGQHNEQSWGRRLPKALRFLLAPIPVATLA